MHGPYRLAGYSIGSRFTVGGTEGVWPCLNGFRANCRRLPESGHRLLPSTAHAVRRRFELSDAESADHARERFETIVGEAIEAGLVLDAVIAENIAQSKALWHLRESIPLAEKMLGKSIKHDVSIPVSRIAEFIETTNQAVQTQFPGLAHVIFGHLGDGNLHYNITRGQTLSEDELLGLQDQVYALVHDSVYKFGGSISAEHGVGQLKRDVLPNYKDPVEMMLMHRIKAALDPQGIMNPGKVLV